MVAAIAGVLLLLPAIGRAETAPQELPAATLEQVRSAGQALLKANHSFVPDPALAQQREDLAKARELILAVSRPQPPPTLKLTPAPGTAASLDREAQADDERTRTRAGQVAGLRKVCSAMATRGRSVAAASAGTSKRLGLRTGEPVLSRLDSLPQEVEAALALPPHERQVRLRELAQELEIRPRPASWQPPEPTPTITTRTSHRRPRVSQEK
ncbi:MAG: hypothetical protein AB1634_16370 [Thermodesulfobacteriota bacterium]